MTPRTVSPAPLDDRRMWRLILARLHDDAGGSDELFLFGQAVRERLLDGNPAQAPKAPGCAECRRDERRSEHDSGDQRVPYDPALGFADEFVTLTMRALSVGQRAEEPYRSLLALLIDCPADERGRAAARQERGATYRQLGRIAHDAGMTPRQRPRWYELARSIPLSDKHASHIIGRMGERRAA